MLSFSDNPTTAIALLLLGSFAVSILYKTFFTPLRKIPGPSLARYTYLWLPWKVSQGRNHIFWRELHAEHGPIVRVGPNRVTFSDPDLLSTVFGAGSTYPKSDFYNSMQFDLNDGIKHSLPRPSKANLFSSRESSYHKRMKASVAQAYSLSFLTQLEPMVNECSEQFITKLRQVSKEGPLDLDKWLHFYAFDVIGMITFSKSFGMIEAGKDDFGLEDLFQGIAYNSVVGVVPGLHAWLLGNDRLLRFLNSFESIRESNPALKVRNVSTDYTYHLMKLTLTSFAGSLQSHALIQPLEKPSRRLHLLPPRHPIQQFCQALRRRHSRQPDDKHHSRKRHDFLHFNSLFLLPRQTP